MSILMGKNGFPKSAGPMLSAPKKEVLLRLRLRQLR